MNHQIRRALPDDVQALHGLMTDLAPWNESGRRFYERLGAVLDSEWLNYELDEDACRALALTGRDSQA